MMKHTQFKFCPKCGTPLVLKMRGDRQRPVCPACGFVVYLNPAVAAGTLVEMDGRVVLIRRGVEPRQGYWGLPAGYVEADESAEEAAIRETHEEAGLEVELDDLLGVYSFGGGARERGVLVLYSAHAVGGELRAGDDALDARTFAPDELPEIAFSTHRDALREWRRARAVIYRTATLDEADVVAQINERYDFEEGRDYRQYVLDPQNELLVAVDDSQVVGFSSLTFHPWNGTANLNQIFVQPNYRRWGIATLLIKYALDVAGEHGARTVIAEAPVNNPVLMVYLKAGFRVCGFIDVYYPPSAHQQSTALFLAYDLASLSPDGTD